MKLQTVSKIIHALQGTILRHIHVLCYLAKRWRLGPYDLESRLLYTNTCVEDNDYDYIGRQYDILSAQCNDLIHTFFMRAEHLMCLDRTVRRFILQVSYSVNIYLNQLEHHVSDNASPKLMAHGLPLVKIMMREMYT